ncbi:MAG TPA: phosphopantetheine-binding protein [Pyrinomonadaceae bacterium]|nr:phosphopantetheine-binding protein [Pyrinomonadaceae bacterium]
MMNTIERFAKLTPNKQSLLTVWLGQHKNGSTAKDAADADKQLVAYVVMKNGSRDTTPLREYLKGQTPAYMVPDTFVALDSLPLTANGKIDRQRLSEPPKTSGIDDNFVAPRTQLEEELASLWSEVLKVERVGINDNFFDLGGHSLLATRLMFQLRERFNVDVPLRALFEAPTIATLAPVIVQSQIEQIDSEDMAQALSALGQA